MNFKVGDKVRVRDDLRYGSRYNNVICNEDMERMSKDNTVLTIKRVIDEGIVNFYYVKENDWQWTDDMLCKYEPLLTWEPWWSNERSVDVKIPYAKFNLDSVTKQSLSALEIEDYKFNTETGETYIKWADKTETRVRPESDTVPNQYVGFVTAYAKKAAGNTSRINSLFDKWAVKKPIKDEIAEEKRIAEETETKRILEKRKAKREKWLIRKEALRIKREYDAKKLAREKYGVPMEFDE